MDPESDVRIFWIKLCSVVDPIGDRELTFGQHLSKRSKY